jgi:putative transposase
VTGGSLVLRPGTRLLREGDVVEIVELAGASVVVRNHRTGQFSTVRIAALVTEARSADGGPDDQVPSLAVALDGLTEQQRAALSERAGHMREVLTGYRSGHQQTAAPGEPRAEYDTSRPLKARYLAKARQLGVTARTIERWVVAYRDSGEAGLVDSRTTGGRGPSVDARWDEALRLVLADLVGQSTPTRSAVLRRVDARLDQAHGPGVVPRPSTATAYRRLRELAKGTNAVAGSAKGRRSIAERPKGVYGRLRASRPGEYVILDTQSLDVFAMEPVTCRWVAVQLTVAQDLFTRCILGLRVTPVSTKAVDVAGVLHQTVVPQPAPPHWPVEACWSYHGLPQQLVFTEDTALPAVPVCPPETLVVDHGKAFLSAHVISVCTRLGVSIQPAQSKKPTDKPTVERFFKTLREGLIQYLPAYKGPDVYSRGEAVEDAAFLFVHEVEDAIREWVALIYHRTKHDGLVVPQWPHLPLSPNEMFEIGVAKAGLLRIPASPSLGYDFLQVAPRTIQHYGVEVNGLRYNGSALDPYRNARSPYGGRWAGFQDLDRPDCWHRLEWEHAPALGTPFSAEAASYARRLAAAQDRWPDPAQALAELLGRWDKGMVTGRRERRMALRLGAERVALPLPDEPVDQVAALPGLTALTAGPRALDGAHGTVDGDVVDGEDDDGEEIFDDPDGGFYDDAFEVLT